jgi:hypothetical protein
MISEARDTTVRRCPGTARVPAPLEQDLNLFIT